MRRPILISSLLSAILACSVLCSYADDGGPSTSDPTALQGEVGTFGVLTGELEKQLGFSTNVTNDEDVLVDDVRPGTAAGDCLHKGDRVLDAEIKGTALDITIERNKQMFKVHFVQGQKGQLIPMLASIKPKVDTPPPAKPFTLGAEQFDMRTDKNGLNGSADRDGNKPFTLNAQQQGGQLLGEGGARIDRLQRPLVSDANHFNLQANQNSRLLSQYNVELLVDRSRSMQKPDCPGGMSRWGWCGMQAANLAKSLDPLVPSGLTIVPFATQYYVFEHASSRHITTIFNNVGLQFGTRLYEPLTERLDNYFAHATANTKPLLLVVITDGVPVPRFEPGLVKNELIEASRRMTSANQVTVIFCQIGGDDRFGQRYLTSLDQNLMSQGARYHFVHTIQFDDLQAMGLGAALASTIRQYTSIDPAKLRAQVN